MKNAEQKLVTGFTLLGFLATYGGDHTVIDKAVLIGGPFVIWVCFRLFIRSIRG